MGGVAFHLLARTIASDYRVALCGEGADELFLGYHRYHVEPEFFARELLERIRATGNEALLHWALEKGLDSPNVASALIKLAREQGLSEYHLPSVDASGMAFGLEVRPPYLNNELAKLVVSLPHSALLDRKENWTKRPLRRILNGIGAPDQRASVRRKRAMSYAVETSWRALLAGMNINEQVLTSCLQCAHTVLRRASPYHPPHVKFSELVKSGLLCPSDT